MLRYFLWTQKFSKKVIFSSLNLNVDRINYETKDDDHFKIKTDCDVKLHVHLDVYRDMRYYTAHIKSYKTI